MLCLYEKNKIKRKRVVPQVMQILETMPSQLFLLNSVERLMLMPYLKLWMQFLPLSIEIVIKC